jgi:hypothetical protein
LPALGPVHTLTSPAAEEARLNITFMVTRDSQYASRLVRDSARNHTWFGAFFLTASLAVSVLCFASRDGRAVLAGLLNLALVGIGAWYVIGSSRRALADLPTSYLEPNTFAVTDEGVTISSSVTSGWFGWDAVTRVEERPYAFLFYFRRSSYRDVPRSGLTRERDEELRRFLVRRGLLDAEVGAVAA